MTDAERWIYFDGPEPERLRPLLDALRADLGPPTPERKERAIRRFLANLDARIAATQAAADGEEGQRSDPTGAPIAPPNAERRGAEDEGTGR